MRMCDWSSDVCSCDLTVYLRNRYCATAFSRRAGIEAATIMAIETRHICLGFYAGGPVRRCIGGNHLFFDFFHLGRSDRAGIAAESVLNRAGADELEKQRSHQRSEERRVGNECVSTCRSQWSSYN